MKKIFKLAAIAVSMALVTSLVACSSGDDDVVDTSTPEYLLTKQIAQYVDSIKYDQNVSDDEIDDLKDAHEDVMKFIDNGCVDCLAVYLDLLEENVSLDDAKFYPLEEIEKLEGRLKSLKTYYETKELFHEACVYKPAIEKALKKLVWFDNIGEEEFESSAKVRKDVLDIGESDGNKIVDKKLNDRQAASMKAYTDAYEALKAALNKKNSEAYETKFKAVDKVIEDFGKTTNVTKTEIAKVIAAVDGICKDIQKNIYDKLTTKKELKYLTFEE